MNCFCGRPGMVWGHFPDCFFPGTIVGSAQKGALMGYSISCICCFKNTSAPAREGHVLLIGTCPQTWCFLCLGESLRFNGCCIQRMMGIWWSFLKNRKTKIREIKQNQAILSAVQTLRSHLEQFLSSLRKSLWWHQGTSGCIWCHRNLSLMPRSSSSLHGPHERFHSTSPTGLLCYPLTDPIPLSCELWEVILLWTFPGWPHRGRKLIPGCLALGCPSWFLYLNKPHSIQENKVIIIG